MENNKYLIALDLDGTLLNDEKEISLKTKEYLNQLEKEGHLIVLCSGRAPRSIQKYYDFLNLTSPIVAYNGALSFDPKNENFKTFHHKIDENFSIFLYKETINKGVISYLAENETTIFCDNDDEFLFAFFEKGNLEVKIDSADKILNTPTFTFVIKIIDESEETKAKLIEKVRELDKDKKYRIRFWRDCPYAEIHVKDVSKAKTLLDVASYLNIDKDHVLVFGDADNDIEMLEMFPNSFLMKNGNPKIRYAAKYITEFDNNHDGVIEELKKFFQKKKG